MKDKITIKRLKKEIDELKDEIGRLEEQIIINEIHLKKYKRDIKKLKAKNNGK